ncbi:helix-turn-helix domain-containing protein [Pararobbsia silviterrae]|uniref:DUF4115 domain-containing protein n=1 Tax=Pararobbsia silviterrae TaxID=1792498 RepID=A0A494XVF1_9BURK|nr:RodZ domain-containing protein [Pararobbsia silviterrae]RKP54601.1 DUF4115 domain-containing protein [Pararobbsia silviterrae]
MSNKPHSASHDAVAESQRLAANDAHETDRADATGPVTPAGDAADPTAEGPAHVDDAQDHGSSALPTAPVEAPLTSAAGVGARLTQLREARRWSIEDVSTRLKVPPNKLRAIEAGDLSALPDMTFTLGVIRAYAKLLGVDAAPLTAAMRQSTGPIEQDLTMPASRGGGLPRSGKMSTVSLSGPAKRRPWVWGIGAVVLAVVVLLLYRSGTEPSAWLARFKPMAATSTAGAASAASTSASTSADAPAEASGDAPGAASDTQAPADTNASASAPTVAAAADTAPQAAPQTAPAAPAASSPAAQTLAAVAAAGSSPAASAPKAASAASKAADAADAAAKAADAEPASDVPEPVDGQQSIHVSVSADTWVSVREAGGKEVMSGLLHAGDAKDAVGKPPLQFVIGNNRGVDALEVNGAPVDPSKYANAKGNVARFTLP